MGNLDLVKQGIADGEDVNKKESKHGNTALMIAAYYHRLDMLKQ